MDSTSGHPSGFTREGKAVIYFVQDQSVHHIKIGFTDGDPEGRLKALQTGSPTGLVLLLTIPGDRTKERELHERFAAARVHGEWFKPTPELLAFMLEQARFYSEEGALEDSRTIRFEMQILEKADDVCQSCGLLPKDELTVFYGCLFPFYRRLWDTPADNVYCLCEECYSQASEAQERIRSLLGSIPPRELNRVIGFLLAIHAHHSPSAHLSLDDYHMADGLGMFFNLLPEEINPSLKFPFGISRNDLFVLIQSLDAGFRILQAAHDRLAKRTDLPQSPPAQ